MDIDCIENYADCVATIGLPAISADGKRVALPDFGPDTPRDEYILTVRIVAVDDARVLSETVIVGDEDYKRSSHPDTGELLPEFRPELKRRIQKAHRSFAAGAFRPLTELGTVHENRPSDEIDGLRASFDGEELVIKDIRAQAVRWRRSIGPHAPNHSTSSTECGPYPVADIAVWVSRKFGVAVARVAYISSDLCTPDYPYIIWR